MKKKLLFVAGLIILSLITNATTPDNGLKKVTRVNDPSGKCFDDKTHILNIGIGFGSAGFYHVGLGSGYVYKSSPAMTLSYEQAYPKKLGPGYLGVGAVVGFKTSSARYDNYYYNGERYYFEDRWTYSMFAARAVYHWDGLNTKNAEVYGGAVVGLRVATYSYRTNSNNPDVSGLKRSGDIRPIIGLFAGARWYFVPKIALFGEIGYGISYLTGGVSFKF